MRTWQGTDCGPGRDLRTPARPVHWPEGSRPISVAIDDELAGQRQHSATPDRPDTIVPQQLYGRPDGRDVQRDGAGHAQVTSKTRSARPQLPVHAHDHEVPWEANPPRRDGFTIHRAHAGGAQAVAIAPDADLGVLGYLGYQHFSGPPDPSPVGVCQWGPCGKVLTTRGSGDRERKFCSHSHRQLAYQKRKLDALATAVH